MLDPMVFFDFDNTITTVDVLDAVIERFAVNEDWIQLEKAWKEGAIGSRECLDGQLHGLRATRQQLSDYLATVEIDPFFKELLSVLKKRGIPSVIVSDSFTYFIREILRHQGIERIKIFANEVRFQKDRLIPSFPFWNPDCFRCAHCKKRHILENKDKFTIYIGDGLSDVCPATHADLVFAKGSLRDFLRKNRISSREFSDLSSLRAFFEAFPMPQRKSKKVLALAS